MQTVKIDKVLLTRVINQLKVDEHVFSLAILATPTGDTRNKFTEDNLRRMELVTVLQQQLDRPPKVRMFGLGTYARWLMSGCENDERGNT